MKIWTVLEVKLDKMSPICLKTLTVIRISGNLALRNLENAIRLPEAVLDLKSPWIL